MYSYTCTNTKFKNSTQKKINIEISIFLYLHKKDTKIQTRASLIVFPTRPHRVYWKYIVGLSDIVVGLCINYIYSMQGSIGQPAKVRKRVRGKNKTLIM